MDKKYVEIGSDGEATSITMPEQENEYLEDAEDCDNSLVAPKKTSKWDIFKKFAGAAASGCATMVVSKYLKENVPAGDNLPERVALTVGMYFLTGLVSSKVAKYAEAELDDFHDSIVKAKEVSDDRKA